MTSNREIYKDVRMSRHDALSMAGFVLSAAIYTLEEHTGGNVSEAMAKGVCAMADRLVGVLLNNNFPANEPGDGPEDAAVEAAVGQYMTSFLEVADKFLAPVHSFTEPMTKEAKDAVMKTITEIAKKFTEDMDNDPLSN